MPGLDRRKRELESRIKCHGNKDRHSLIHPQTTKPVIKTIEKKSWWRRFLGFIGF